ERGPQDLHDALLQASLFEMHQLMSVTGQREKDGWKGQSDTYEFIDDMPHLRRIALEKIPAGRDVEKEILHRNVRTRGHSHRFLAHDTAVLDPDKGAGLVFRSSRFQLDLRDGGDGRQRFPTEPHRFDMEKIVDLPDLGRRMPFECHTGIGLAHPFTVVYHLDQRLPSILDE